MTEEKLLMGQDLHFSARKKPQEAEETLPKEKGEINTPTHSSSSLLGPGAQDALGICPLGARKGGEGWEWIRGGQTEVMLHDLRFPASLFWSQGYSLCWASSELQKHVFYPSTSSSTAFWYKENILNRSLNGCCHDFWWCDSVGLLSCSLRSGNNLDEQPVVIP